MTTPTITNHKLDQAEWKPSPHFSGEINPNYIVMHYTAGWTASGAVQWMQNPKAKVSAHLVIGRDGQIYQMVPFNVKAWHAGPSEWNGVRNLNGSSIGIELVNPGWVQTDHGRFFHNGKLVDDKLILDNYELIRQDHERVSSKGNVDWFAYTKPQLDALENVTDFLIENYDIKDIVSHEEIDRRGWKTDPGPAFPMEYYKKKMMSREDEEFHTIEWLQGEAKPFRFYEHTPVETVYD